MQPKPPYPLSDDAESDTTRGEEVVTASQDEKLGLRMDLNEAQALYRLLAGQVAEPGDDDILDALTQNLVRRMRQLRKRPQLGGAS